MDELAIYRGKSLVGLEFAEKPSSWPNMPKDYHIFRRLNATECEHLAQEVDRKAHDENFHGNIQKLMSVLKTRIHYWESKIPKGLHCFIHHARFETEEECQKAFAKLKANSLPLLGIYSIDPSISIYPSVFPIKEGPNFWNPEEKSHLTPESMFFLNFFPEQKYLNEHVYQGTLAIYSESYPGLYESNNFMNLISKNDFISTLPDKIVAVNFNRYRDAYGFYKAVSAGAIKSAIVKGHEDFIWYGMLAKLVN